MSRPKGTVVGTQQKMKRYAEWAEQEIASNEPGWFVRIDRRAQDWSCIVSRTIDGLKGELEGVSLGRDLDCTNTEAELKYAIGSLIQEINLRREERAKILDEIA